MMNEIQVFSHEQFGEIRSVKINDEPWFVGSDIAFALGYVNPRKALIDHVDDEDKNTVTIRDGIRGNPNMTAINESGVYSLIMSSKLPAAKQFKRWVTSEVLPSIRKHGAYVKPSMEEEMLKALTNPDAMIKIFTHIKHQQEKNKALTEQIEHDKPKVIFADAVSVADTTILIGDMAKLLKQNGIEMGQKRLFEWLREHGYLIKRKGSDWNMPTQRSMEMGLFEIKETVVALPDGATRVNKTTKVSGKGQIYFVNLFLKDKDPDVTIEIDPDVA